VRNGLLWAETVEYVTLNELPLGARTDGVATPTSDVAPL
jgi:hypothetical protein